MCGVGGKLLVVLIAVVLDAADDIQKIVTVHSEPFPPKF